MTSFYSGGYRGDTCGSLEPPFETKLFHIHDEFPEKSVYSIKLSGTIFKSNPFVNLNPLARNPGYAPASAIYSILFTWASTAHMGAHMGPIWAPYRLLAGYIYI